MGTRSAIAENIKKLMEKKGVTPTQVCDALNVPKSTFSNWCTGKIAPRVENLDMLAEYFDVTVSDLLAEKIFISYSHTGSIDENNAYRKLMTYYIGGAEEEAERLAAINVLLDAAKDATADDLKKAAEILKVLKSTETDR